MHDYQVIEAVVRRLTEAGLRDVTEVRIRVGPAFSPVALRQAYEMVTLGTPLASSHLRVETAEQPCACRACGEVWTVRSGYPAGHMVLCPACGAPTPTDGLTDVQIVHVDGPTTLGGHP